MTANAPAQTSAAAMYRAIVGIGTLCALVIVGVYQATEARIADNQRRFLAGAVAQVLPAARSTREVARADDGGLRLADAGSELPAFLGLDAEGNLSGAVIAAQGMGYQDNIRLLYAYSFKLNAIVGFKILDSRETPGLGDRVEVEPHFLASFQRLDASLKDEGLAHPIVTVRQGEKTAPWQIDGITGATITSEAIGRIVNDSAQTWVPLLEREAESIAALAATKEPAP